MTTQTEALKLALEALDGLYMPNELERVNKAIIAINEALSSPNGEAQQEVYSNYCFQCEALSRELAALKAQQPQNEIRGLSHSNEQVEPVAKVNFYTGKIEWLMPVSFDIPVTIDVPPMYLYTHPPVPTAQPKEPEQEPVAVVETIGGYPDESSHVAKWLVPYKSLKAGDKLYTTPPQRDSSATLRTWVGLTDDEIDKLVGEFRDTPINLTFAIEAKLKAKNERLEKNT